MCIFSDVRPTKVHKAVPHDKPIVAYKAFRLKPAGFSSDRHSLVYRYSRRLGVWSPFQRMEWKPNVRRKADRLSEYGNSGFYAMKSPDSRAMGMAIFIAKVELSGKIYEYKTGYRAQYCKIAAVSMPERYQKHYNVTKRLTPGWHKLPWVTKPALLKTV